MPSQIATIFCWAFVIFLLRHDRKQAPEVSFAMWIPTIWLFLVTSRPLSFWLGSQSGNMEEGNASDRIFFSLLWLICLIILAMRKFNWLDFIRGNLPLIVLMAFLLTSMVWSDTPYITLKRWMREILIPVFMAIVISTEIEPRQALISIFRRNIYALIPLSFLLVNYYPSLGRQYGRWSGVQMWTGVATQKNGLTLVCAFSIFFFVWLFIRRCHGFDTVKSWYSKFIDIFIVLLSIYLFLGPEHSLTYSATSFLCLVLAIIVLLIFLLLKRYNISVGANLLSIVSFVIIFYGTITPFLGGLKGFDFSGALHRDSTLTGRADDWALLIPYAKKNLALGCGFSSFWNEELRANIDAHAHNGYLDIILAVGLVGLFFWAIFVVSLSRKAQREMTREADWGNLFFCMTLIALIHNITESSFTSFSSIFSIGILFLYVSLTKATIPGSAKIS